MSLTDESSTQSERMDRPQYPSASTVPSQGRETQDQDKHVNVGSSEREISLAAGAIIALLGLSRRSLPGLLLAGVGGALVYRGVTGYCSLYDALGIDTSAEGQSPEDQAEQIAARGIHVEQSFLINRPANELFAFWRNFENLPKIMTHLEAVTTSGERRSHWITKANLPGSKRFEWDAEITREETDRLIAWQSLPGADIDNIGEIRFSKAPGDRGTEVHVTMDYVPPAGRLGHYIASMLGQNPRRVLREDLRNFKRVMELGEVPTIVGQPHGSCAGRGKRETESQWKPFFI